MSRSQFFFFLMFKCYNTLNKYIREMSIHPAVRPVRRMVQCEGIVSLVMPCLSGTVGPQALSVGIWVLFQWNVMIFFVEKYTGYHS